MKVVPEGDKSVSYGGRFTGTVELEMLHATPTDAQPDTCLLYTSPSPRDRTRSRMPSSA